MKKFEYHMMPLIRGGSSYEELTGLLNSLGEEGWELCSIDYGAFIFKREQQNAK
jgi:hypothetical protein